MSSAREERGSPVAAAATAASESQPVPVSAEYILHVQSLIEQCLLLNMTCDEIVNALSTHSKVKPVVTLTVWKELKKENESFFTAYEKHQSARNCCRVLMEETNKVLAEGKQDRRGTMTQGTTNEERS